MSNLTKTRLFLVRHGETVWHHENRYAGRSDIALTDKGRVQAEQLGRWAGTAKLDAIWVSPLSRARATAEPAAQATGLTPRIDARLREQDFGIAEGLTLDELGQKHPEALKRYQADPVAHPLPEAEDPRSAAARTVQCLHAIAATHTGGRVLVVFHNTLMRLALCTLLGIELGRYRRVFPLVLNVALTEVELCAEQASLLAFNKPVDE